MSSFKTPILFLVFNRPDTTERAFKIIRQLKPEQLFVAADGPREDKAGEEILCNEVRKLILDNIDWTSEIKTLFREKNLGCGEAVSSAISWFFSQVEEGIIIEDDVIPQVSFFQYAADLLQRYREDKTMMHISGSSFHSFKGTAATSHSYYFSNLPFIWGWATWKRAWQLYDYNIIKNSPLTDIESWLGNVFDQNQIIEYWLKVFYDVSLKDLGYTWDYQWSLSVWKNKGKAILPSQNLVTNIGWGEGATHTFDHLHYLGNLPSFPIKKKLNHPKRKLIAHKIDLRNFNNYYVRYPKNKTKETVNAVRAIFGKVKFSGKATMKSILYKLLNETK